MPRPRIRPRPRHQDAALSWIRSPTDLGDRFSISDQEKLEKIILPTEFQNLKDFQTFLKIANYGITRMETPKSFLPAVAPEFLQRNVGLEQMLKEEPQSPASMPRAEIPQFAP